MTESRKRELQAELEGMTVHQETGVGWDENTPPNETLDQYGNLLARNRGVVPCAGQSISQASRIR